MLVMITILTTLIIFVPGFMVDKARQSAWLAPLAAVPASLIPLWFVLKLGKRFPGQTLPQYSEIIFGKALGKLMGLTYVLFLLILNTFVVREFTEFINIALLPQTPGPILSAFLILVAAYAVAHGLEVIARMTQFLLPIVLFTLVLMILLAAPKMELGNLLPLFEIGVGPIAYASLYPAVWFGEVVVLALFLPAVNKPAEAGKKSGLAIVLVAVLLTFQTAVTLGVLGPYVAGEFYFPFWSVLRYVEYGAFVQRIDSWMSAVWIAGMVVKAALFYYLICSATAEIFKLKDYKPVIYPMAVLQVLAATLAFGNSVELMDALQRVWPLIALTFEYFLPAFFLILAVVRNKKGVKTR